MNAHRQSPTCQDHLAGRLGAALCDAMLAAGRMIETPDGVRLTLTGVEFFQNFGVELGLGDESPAAFCHFCHDGGEERPHLAGVVGAALAARCLDLGWVKPVPGEPDLVVTEIGRHELVETFGLPAAWDQLSR